MLVVPAAVVAAWRVCAAPLRSRERRDDEGAQPGALVDLRPLGRHVRGRPSGDFLCRSRMRSGAGLPEGPRRRAQNTAVATHQQRNFTSTRIGNLPALLTLSQGEAAALAANGESEQRRGRMRVCGSAGLAFWAWRLDERRNHAAAACCLVVPPPLQARGAEGVGPPQRCVLHQQRPGLASAMWSTTSRARYSRSARSLNWPAAPPSSGPARALPPRALGVREEVADDGRRLLHQRSTSR